MTPTNAIIFLADQRGVSQLDWFRSYHSFNFGAYQAENRAPFGALRVLNDDTLDYERSLEMAIDQATDVVLIPLVGALEYEMCIRDRYIFGRVRWILRLPRRCICNRKH